MGFAASGGKLKEAEKIAVEQLNGVLSEIS
jgi:hypothetical protein